jgi:hypothetical protein
MSPDGLAGAADERGSPAVLAATISSGYRVAPGDTRALPTFRANARSNAIEADTHEEKQYLRRRRLQVINRLPSSGFTQETME